MPPVSDVTIHKLYWDLVLTPCIMYIHYTSIYQYIPSVTKYFVARNTVLIVRRK